MSPRLRLVLLSFLMLFVELALIRWLGSNVVYLSFFSNFVLLGSFLGIGLGFIRARSPRDLTKWIPVALTFFIGFILIARVSVDRSGDELIYFGDPSVTGLPAWLMLPVIFLAVTGVMALVGEAVGRQFVAFEPLEAYRLDIAGSLLGILGFSLLSLLSAPPLAWGALAAGLMLLVFREVRRPLQLVALLGMVIMLARESTVPQYSWSPYYKLAVVELEGSKADYHITVNGIPHQDITSVDAVRSDSDSIYLQPYTRAGGAEGSDVLVIGAGNGTDVALALSEGVASVDAVEIDPRLLEIGAELHPDRPYADARVTTHVADGREYLENTEQTYDLILFALPDSLTLVSGQGALRLESYLFTVEAMDAARERLRPGGVFAMYNYYREDWLVERLAGTLETVYGIPPCVDSVGDVGRLAMLTVGRDAAVDCEGGTLLSATAARPATDNYPFLYLRSPGLPPIYLATVLLIVAGSIGLVRSVAGPLRGMTRYVDLFFMGAAFLLLETKAVVQFALLFGTTWIVNSLVFAGVLVSVLLAVEVARRVPNLPRTALYLVLFASLAVAFVVPPGALLNVGPVPRFLAATALWFTPIFAANLIFAERFRRAEAAHLAFGTNLLGAMVGGVLEYLSLVVGFQLLVVVVAVLYLGAFMTGREVPLRVPGLARLGTST